MTTVMFTPGPEGHTVRFPFDPAIVAAIKQTVPGYARSWHPQRRAWTVDPGWAPVLADTLRTIGHTIAGLDEPPPRHVHGDADWARMLFRRVGPGRAAPVYRALSRCLHPDVGGDTALQRELNEARDELSIDDRRESA